MSVRPDNQAGRIAARELAVVVAAFTLGAVVMTLPLWAHPTRRLPSDLTDTLFGTWVLAWDSDRLRHALQGVWDAPIYYPYRHALAFAENLLGVALFAAPVYWASGNPVLTYNAAFLSSFVVAGVGMYLLTAELTGSRAAAVIGGTYYAFCPFRMAQISHIQMLATGWLPLALLGLHKYFSTGRRAWLALFAVSSCLQALSNSYMAYFMALPIAVVCLNGMRRAHRARATCLRDVAIASAIVVAALAPVALQYYRVRSAYGQVRGPVERVNLSADLRSYLVLKKQVGIWRWLPTAVVAKPEKELFPGFVAVLLAAVAIARTIRRRTALGEVVWVYLAIALAAVTLSLGPTVQVFGRVVTEHGPYGWLLRVVPGMDGMRVPARFALVAFMALSVLAACGAAIVLGRIPDRWRRFAVALAVAAILAEGWEAPIDVYAYSARGRPTDRFVAEWLENRPPGAVLHLPVWTSNLQELNFQYATLLHGHPIVNGYSGYSTPLVDWFRDRDSPLYDLDHPADVVRMLRALGIRYVIVNVGDYNLTQLSNDEHRRSLQIVRASGQVVREQRLLDTYAFELEPWVEPPSTQVAEIGRGEWTLSTSEAEDRARYITDGDADTRWIGNQNGSSWVRVEFAAPIDVARVDVQLASRSLIDFPRALQIDATDAQGRTTAVYSSVPYPELMVGFVRDPKYPVMAFRLSSNAAVALAIREVGQAPGRWWSVHELRLWRRLGPM